MNPQDLKTALYCLGKTMPFYDRNIEFIMGGKTSVISSLEKRYSVGNKSPIGQTIKIGAVTITSSPNNHVIVQNEERIEMFQKPINTISSILSRQNRYIIRPLSSEIIEKLLLDQGETGAVVRPGEFLVHYLN